MFCTKCGRQLHDEDIFCAHCGTKVRDELLQGNTDKPAKYEEVVFNPPFKAEAERRTRQISEEVNTYNSEPKRETVHFDWNLDGFPTQQTKKEEKFELNWDDVIERKKENKPVTVERIIPDNQKPETEQDGKADEPINTDEKIRVFESEIKEENTKKEDSLSIEDLERELFGTEELSDITDSGFTIKYNRKDLEKDKESQFNTYNAKRDAFQELLDKERARIESIENQRKSQWEEITKNDLAAGRETKKPLEFDEVFIEPKTPLVPPLKEVGVVLPPLTLAVMAEEKLQADSTVTEDIEAPVEIEVPVESDIEDNIAEEKVTPFPEEQGEPEEPKESAESQESAEPEISEESEEEQKKVKLRYSDVFPADTFESNDDDDNGSDDSAPDSKKEIEEDDDDEEEYKGNRVIKTLIAILAIIVAIELVIIGVKAIAPDSGFSKAVDNIMEKVTSLFTGDARTENDPVEAPKDDYIEEYIRTFSSEAENIGMVSHDANLKYDLNKTYAFADIGETQEFENSSWDENDATMSKTYAHSIISALISHYNNWKEGNHDDDLIGINTLEIGEIRTADGGYYVLNRVTYAAADGQTVIKYETVHLRTAAEDVVVDEVKEETV